MPIKKLRILCFNLWKFDFHKLIFTVSVRGESMWPVLIPGKRYLASGLFGPRVGDLIVFRNSKNSSEIFVKKIEKALDGEYEVGGLVSWSSSSRDFGVVGKNLILGKILI